MVVHAYNPSAQETGGYVCIYMQINICPSIFILDGEGESRILREYSSMHQWKLFSFWDGFSVVSILFLCLFAFLS
jgi:hypothetical protein